MQRERAGWTPSLSNAGEIERGFLLLCLDDPDDTRSLQQ